MPVSGSGTSKTSGRGVPRGTPYTDEDRGKFLDQLAQTCNVAASAAASGIDISSLYRWRQADAAFAAEWRAALLTGYDRVEEQLLGLAGVAGPEIKARLLDEGFDARFALSLLAMHHARLKTGLDRMRTNRVKRATDAEVDEELIRRLAIIGRKRKARSRG